MYMGENYADEDLHTSDDKNTNFTKYIVVGVVALISIIFGIVLFKRRGSDDA